MKNRMQKAYLFKCFAKFVDIEGFLFKLLLLFLLQLRVNIQRTRWWINTNVVIKRRVFDVWRSRGRFLNRRSDVAIFVEFRQAVTPIHEIRVFGRSVRVRCCFRSFCWRWFIARRFGLIFLIQKCYNKRAEHLVSRKLNPTRVIVQELGKTWRQNFDSGLSRTFWSKSRKRIGAYFSYSPHLVFHELAKMR